MRNEIPLTDEQIEAAFAELDACVNMDAAYGIDVLFTRETLADFEAASDAWHNSKVPRYKVTGGGFNALCINAAQVRKGDWRRDLVIIDFGTVRAFSS